MVFNNLCKNGFSVKVGIFIAVLILFKAAESAAPEIASISAAFTFCPRPVLTKILAIPSLRALSAAEVDPEYEATAKFNSVTCAAKADVSATALTASIACWSSLAFRSLFTIPRTSKSGKTPCGSTRAFAKFVKFL